MTLDGPVPSSDASASFRALEDKIVFRTAPFAEETELTGPMAAKLFVSSSTTDADVFVNVHLFDPDGVEVTFQGAVDPQTPIGQGWLRASQRKLDPKRSLQYRPFHAHDEVQPLVPSEVYELDIEIWVTCIVVPAGYHLALSVAGRDYEADGEGEVIPNFKNELKGSGPYIHIDPDDRPSDVCGGTTTVHTGPQRAAFLLLPVIPPKA
jgi:predicted acyl esterase